MNQIGPIALAICIVATSTAPASAQNIYGAGNESCAKWTNWRQTKEWIGPSQWIAGWLTNANVDRVLDENGSDLFDGTKPDDLLAWVDTYCRDNPFHTLLFAATALENQLRANSSRNNKR